MLSNTDIYVELNKAKDLAIHPLKLENINGSSINLTASKFAWHSTKHEKDEQGRLITIPGKKAVENDLIKIPSRETVNILTNEAIFVSRKISGTYHSRVSLSAKGLGNISTTLDPKWCGLSLISITNNSNENQEIPVGSGIVTLTFDYLNRKANKDNIEIAASRQDLYSGFDLSKYLPEEIEYLYGNSHKKYTNIIKNMKESDEFEEIKCKTKMFKLKKFLDNKIVLLVIGAVITKLVPFLWKLIKSWF